MLHIKGSFDVYANVHLLVVELLSLPQKVARLKVVLIDFQRGSHCSNDCLIVQKLS